MTCIAGVRVGDRVWIGGDSCSSRESGEQVTSAVPKVVRLRDYLVGFTSSWRMGQLLTYRLEPELPVARPDDVDPLQWLATEFVDAVRRTLTLGGFAHVENNVEAGGEFLVAYAARLFVVQGDYQVNESAHGYEAVGSGAEVALGALAATDRLELGGKQRIKLALRAAERHMTGVRRPFLIERADE